MCIAEGAAGDTFLYLTTKGRVSGLPRTIEIWFVEYAGRYYIVSEMREASGWVKNLVRDPAVRFRVGKQSDDAQPENAIARVVEDERVLAEVGSRMQAKYGWSDGLTVEIAPA